MTCRPIHAAYMRLPAPPCLTVGLPHRPKKITALTVQSLHRLSQGRGDPRAVCGSEGMVITTTYNASPCARKRDAFFDVSRGTPSLRDATRGSWRLGGRRRTRASPSGVIVAEWTIEGVAEEGPARDVWREELSTYRGGASRRRDP
jgi:hypothetical protein